MKSINLLFLYEFPTEDLVSYADHLMKREKKNGFDLEEYKCLKKLIKLIINDVKPGAWNDFFISYSLPRISKELDLLKVTENSILNIELKSDYPNPKIKILNQLIQNRDYLKRLEKKNLFLFTVILKTEECYMLNEKDDLEPVPLKKLIDTLNTYFQEPGYEESTSLFKDDEFLTSPLINPEDFLNQHYYLTQSQESIKENILKSLKEGNQFVSLNGGYGTGKTLLLYDIAQTLVEEENSSVLIIHTTSEPISFMFNDGLQWPFEVTFIKNICSSLNEIENYRYILVDESQRLYPETFNKIKNIVKENNLSCIFGLDPWQWISDFEKEADINKRIEQLVPKRSRNKLTEKIRCPEDINKFIPTLFNLNIPINNDETSDLDKIKIKNIEILYSDSYESTKKIISSLSKKDYTFINHSSPPYNKPQNSWKDYGGGWKDTHDVIGQEFEKVIVIIDENFYFNDSKKLEANTHPYLVYSYLKTLEQALTRATSKLLIIVENNLQVFESLFALILNNS